MKELKKAAELNRHQLGSIDLGDILEEEKITDIEQLELALRAVEFNHAYFEKVLKEFINEQLKFIGMKADSENQLLFGRGTINGLFLVQEWFVKQMGIIEEEHNKAKKGSSIPDEVPPMET